MIPPDFSCGVVASILRLDRRHDSLIQLLDRPRVTRDLRGHCRRSRQAGAHPAEVVVGDEDRNCRGEVPIALAIMRNTFKNWPCSPTPARIAWHSRLPGGR